jgi:hypothetical protein
VTARIDTAPNALDWVVAVGRSGRVVLEFSDAGDPWSFPGTPVFTVVGLETTVTATLATSNRDGAEDDQVVIEWDEDAFEGYGGQLSRYALDAGAISILPIFAGAFRILPEGFPGNPTVGTYEITLGDATVEVDVALAGRSATVTVGDVETLPSSSPATVVNVGTAEDAVLDFGLPRGLSGVVVSDEEPDDTTVLWVDTTEDSPLPITVDVGTTTTLAAGSAATVVNSGDTVDVVLDFGVPKGDKGDAATVDVGTVTTLPAGSDAAVTNSGSTSAAVLDFELPRGPTGIVVSTLAPQDPDEGTVWTLPTNGHTAVHAGGQWWPLAPTTDNVAKVLSDAVLWIDADEGGGQLVPNIGSGGSALDAQLGSTTGSDGNDPQLVPHNGVNYVRVGNSSGTSTNRMTVPDSADWVASTSLDVRAAVVLRTLSSARGIIAHGSGTGSSISWSLRVDSSNRLTLYLSGAGGEGLITGSSIGSLMGVGNVVGVRATYEVSSGDVKFWTKELTEATATAGMSSDTGWTQLGSTQTSTAGALTNAPATVVSFVAVGTGSGGSADYYGVQVATDGTVKLTVDTSVITSGSATSFLATTGQTVTIARATSAARTVVVTHPLWLFHTDDYMEIPDDPLLDIAAADSFTAMFVHRSWTTLNANVSMIAKKANTTEATLGWLLSSGSTAAQGQLQAGDGTAGTTAVSGNRTSGALSVVTGVRDVDADEITTYLGATAGTPVTDATTDTLANSEVVRIGRLSGAGTGYLAAEVFAALVWRRALTAGEITAVDTYFTTRMA